MKPAVSTGELARPAFIVRDSADINRLFLRLLTRWTLPRVEVRIESLPAVSLQLVQHRITRIANRPLGGLAAILAASTFVAGTYLAWTSFDTLVWTAMQVWQQVVLMAIVAMYAGLLGMCISSAWTRLRLMRELVRLRRALAGKVSRQPAHYAGRVSWEPAAAFSTGMNGGLADDQIVRQPVVPRRGRSKVVLRGPADLNRLLVHLVTHWKLPRVQFDVDGVAPVDVQRAQHRLALLSDACNCALGAWLAAATVLGGLFFVEWRSTHNWDWMMPASWGSLGLVPVAALCAALTGIVIEMVWTRVKMMWVASGVRHRLGT